MNMQYFWVVEKQRDENINFSWNLGRENLGNYVTKHHPSKIHKEVQSTYLHIENSLKYLQRSLTPEGIFFIEKKKYTFYLKNKFSFLAFSQ